MEVLLICRVRGGVWQTVRHECAEGNGLTLHHRRYIPRRHLGSRDMERQARFPEVYAAATRAVKVGGAFKNLEDETYLSPSVSAAVTNISWGVAFRDG